MKSRGMINPQAMAVLGAVVLLAVALWYAYALGSRHTDIAWKAKTEAARAKAEADARQTEKNWQGALNEASKTYLAKINNQRADLRTALDELRNRADRQPAVSDAPRADCKGATGAELSRTDAAFLDWEAARADRLRVALELCYQYADTVGRR